MFSHFFSPLQLFLSCHCRLLNTLTLKPPRFETQLASVKERLEAAKAGSTRGLNSPTAGGFSIGSRIAKPLRGGGGGGGDVAANPAIANLQNQGENKRSSWFFKSS